jgi:hypothetical protein
MHTRLGVGYASHVQDFPIVVYDFIVQFDWEDIDNLNVRIPERKESIQPQCLVMPEVRHREPLELIDRVAGKVHLDSVRHPDEGPLHDHVGLSLLGVLAHLFQSLVDELLSLVVLDA